MVSFWVLLIACNKILPLTSSWKTNWGSCSRAPLQSSSQIDVSGGMWSRDLCFGLGLAAILFLRPKFTKKRKQSVSIFILCCYYHKFFKRWIKKGTRHAVESSERVHPNEFFGFNFAFSSKDLTGIWELRTMNTIICSKVIMLYFEKSWRLYP